MKAAGSDGHEVRCYDDAIRFVAEVRDRDRLVRTIDRMFPASAAASSVSELPPLRALPEIPMALST